MQSNSGNGNGASDDRRLILGWWPCGFGYGYRRVGAVSVSPVWHVGFLAEAGCVSVGLGFVLIEVLYR